MLLRVYANSNSQPLAMGVRIPYVIQFPWICLWLVSATWVHAKQTLSNLMGLEATLLCSHLIDAEIPLMLKRIMTMHGHHGPCMFKPY